MGNTLRAFRQKEGLSVHDVHEMTGVSVSTIHAIESAGGRRKTSIGTASAIAHGLYVQVDDLFDRLDLTDEGRPVFTGKPKRPARRKETLALCPSCNVFYLPHIGCETCGNDRSMPLTA